MDDRETGLALDPKWDANGLITGVVTDAASGELLMVAHLNAAALTLTQATDDQALSALHLLARREGIICALESAHAVHATLELAQSMPKGSVLLINVSGRGDKDLATIARHGSAQ